MDVEVLLENNRQLSQTGYDLAKCLIAQPQLQHLPFNKESEAIAPFMQGFKYKISPWPIIINQKLINDFDKQVRELPLIFNSVLKRALVENKAATCKYLNISTLAADLYLNSTIELNDILARYDLIISDGLSKIIELNCGASLGGWEPDFLVSEAFRAIELLPDQRWNLKHRKVVVNLYKSYCQAVLRLKGAKAKGNFMIFVSRSNFSEQDIDNLQQYFRQIYRQVRPEQFSQGELFFFYDEAQIEVDASGVLTYQGQVMDALVASVEDENDLSESVMTLLEAGALKDQYYFPSRIGLTLFANKLLLAFVHEPQVLAKMTANQQQLIKQHIPWATSLNREVVHWQGQEYSLENFLETFKDQLVIKKSRSMQGRDVVVGKSSSLEQWRMFYRQYREDGDWLIQQYCEPDSVVHAEPELGLNQYSMVWGIFSLQGRYSGGFIRAMVDDPQSKVINSACGACDFLLLEEQQQKLKLTI